ncbi:hypothetical protein [Amantichitinum ursilacus]|uniref:Uncharacterized protein n=1 Tax=Amantichitinum ursilacus TaxID=857265 RepID=A0A0N0XKI1_9NEIS|nr:hypothetical protein [Amantichitinum ursilacus]KPC52277.1 hypothetical protein WG78_14500 [Amantichitinum ursilacus]
MAFHRVGRSYLSDAEMHARTAHWLDILVPGLICAVGVYFLDSWLSRAAFFVQHTTTTKLIEVSVGLIMFSAGYVYRKYIVALGFLIFVLAALIAVGSGIWHWLLK